MLGALSNSYRDLDADQRRALIELLEKRDEYLPMAVKLNELRIAALQNPTPEAEKAVQEYASLMMPVRLKLAELTVAIAQDAINLDQLKSMLPMVLAALMGSINFPMLFAALNLEPDMAQTLVDKGTEFFSKGLPDD